MEPFLFFPLFPPPLFVVYNGERACSSTLDLDLLVALVCGFLTTKHHRCGPISLHPWRSMAGRRCHHNWYANWWCGTDCLVPGRAQWEATCKPKPSISMSNLVAQFLDIPTHKNTSPCLCHCSLTKLSACGHHARPDVVHREASS